MSQSLNTSQTPITWKCAWDETLVENSDVCPICGHTWKDSDAKWRAGLAVFQKPASQTRSKQKKPTIYHAPRSSSSRKPKSQSTTRKPKSTASSGDIPASSWGWAALIVIGVILLIIFLAATTNNQSGSNNSSGSSVMNTPVSQTYVQNSMNLDTIRTSTFTVQANLDWQDTNMEVNVGDDVNIRYVSGTWTTWKGGHPYVGPTGNVGLGDPKNPNHPLPSAYPGVLIGRVGSGSIMEVGQGIEFQASLPGALLLRMNDDYMQDNDGSITVDITIQKPATPYNYNYQTTSPNSGSCYRWDQITTGMVGQVVCVYGTIYQITKDHNGHTRFSFTSQHNSFFMVSSAVGDFIYSNGGGVAQGDCIMKTAEIQVTQGIPYLDIGSTFQSCQ